ncbi:signal transduction histidine kinase [Desulfosalsimonas propionicica]|uniref:histidine kinase n=1 Tax=Desulfosalsimonas propionicica TaxID=332175 RepID=A0A7W0C9L3_9BACT|nr:signal transduction histidine kinase [Desulfosalsimonas propionicica]
MRLKSLKTGITVNVAFVVLLAVGLTDFVFLQIAEQKMVHHHVASARAWIKQLAGTGVIENIRATAGWNIAGPESGGISAMLVSAGNSETQIFGTFSEPLSETIRATHKQAVSRQKPQIVFCGRIWGVLGPKSQYALISRPVPETGRVVTGVVPLFSVYGAMRATQKMAFGYLLFNIVLLVSFGAWRISRMVTRPIDRLIRNTDAYQASEPLEWFSEKQKDEFGRLSGALNQMLSRIEADRRRLKQSLASLEQANQQLKDAKNDIVRAEKLASIGRLSAGLAHEIGNPIGIVLGYLGLLKSRCVAPEDQTGMDYIHRAESEIQRVHTIIGQLLDFSRKCGNKPDLLDFHDLIREVGEMLACQPLFSNIDFQYRLNAQNCRIYADADQVHQVLVNLMINAADSIRQSGNARAGEICLSTRCIFDARLRRAHDPPAGFIALKIRDNGAGIDPQHIEQVFDPFFTTKAPGKGTGLGLSVSYMIIQQTGGDITVASPKPGATEMVLRLPLAAGAGQKSQSRGENKDKGENGWQQ